MNLKAVACRNRYGWLSGIWMKRSGAGVLTEGGIVWRDECRDIVVELARRGIMSSICSKNDFEPVRALLTEREIWDYFIFPSIDWSPKGARIKQIVEAVQLRPQSVILIDDNHLNLEEAKFFSPGIQVASDAVIPSILSDPLFVGQGRWGVDPPAPIQGPGKAQGRRGARARGSRAATISPFSGPATSACGSRTTSRPISIARSN